MQTNSFFKNDTFTEITTINLNTSFNAQQLQNTHQTV